MEIIYFLVPIGVVMLGIAIGLFTWAVRSDQFEDLDREGHRILFDEDMITPPAATSAEAASAETTPTETTPTKQATSAPETAPSRQAGVQQASPQQGQPPNGTKS